MRDRLRHRAVAQLPAGPIRIQSWPNYLVGGAMESPGVDEEIGSASQQEHEHNHELPSLMHIDNGNCNGKGSGGGGRHHAMMKSMTTNIKQQRLRSPSHSSATPTTHHSSSSFGDHDNKRDDGRSRALFLKTAFWITLWYGTSLATLFLNKIILSRPDSSVHVLGMCQMTAAAFLGGWSAFGCTGILVGAMRSVLRIGLAPSGTSSGTIIGGVVNAGGATLRIATINRAGEGGGGNRGPHVRGGVDEECAVGIVRSLSSSSSSSSSSTSSSFSSSSSSSNAGSKSQDHDECPGTPSKSTDRVITYQFVRDMSVVGILRGLTVVLGLVALEHVPVSFVETIKATAPAFTVIFARLILQERTPPPVMLSLVPVVGGLVMCSASELRFDVVGFVAAVMNNCADCVQNVLSKRMLAHIAPTTLQFYASAAAMALQAPFLLRDVAGLAMRRQSHQADDWGGGDAIVPMRDATEDDGFAYGSSRSPMYHHSEMSTTSLLVIDAVFYHLQSVSAYCTMGCMNPVSQSVANTLKRALLVWASVLYFGNPVTNSGIAGIIMVVIGVFLYNHIRRIHQS